MHRGMQKGSHSSSLGKELKAIASTVRTAE